MKILLLGKNGQLGRELQYSLKPLGELIALDRNSDICGDLTNLKALHQTILTLTPDVIVNAAAYTQVDNAEKETELAYLVNAKAPEVMAQACASTGAWFIHYSTDYVFDGSGASPWKESDITRPLNVYGKSKLDGEKAIINSECNHLIFRTSWVYGMHGNNFIKAILRLAREKSSLNIVSDQIGVPTDVELLANVSVNAIKTVWQNPELGGLYHLAPSGETSWYDYARFLINEAKKIRQDYLIQDIYPITSEEYPTPAQRPLNSRLDTTKLTSRFSVDLPEWKTGVVRTLGKILGSAL
ncbi:dTDP-4-dehydrorhamnose reductase [Legionella israelensis]|uniref:dTDP-4-dehydrorhamnose reductase n=1 Tax=Legionella israelensis TaxID=454 RepID=UPI0011817624|nr:dTDP-4-dehydrorhamnose reductase [Legionella israelensis]QDP72341.1 dTDP-4-dehydrorhamnose reductase [Legionella israelensis]